MFLMSQLGTTGPWVIKIKDPTKTVEESGTHVVAIYSLKSVTTVNLANA